MMQELMMLITAVLALALIVLVTLQPREVQRFSNDLTDHIGKPGYWQTHTALKVATLLVSLALCALLLSFMLINY